MATEIRELGAARSVSPIENSGRSEPKASRVAQHEEDGSAEALSRLRAWIEAHDYAGYEPYDILNSRLLPRSLKRSPWDWTLIQAGRRFLGTRTRKFLRVPPSKNPKALALFLAGYCDLARSGEATAAKAEYLKQELKRLRSPNEQFFCWGYDWDFVSLRGPCMRAFFPNSVASVFCGEALLDQAEIFGDSEAEEMAVSLAEFLVRRLNRPVNTAEHLCFSYTPENQTVIFNTSALVGAFLARVAARRSNREYVLQARRVMQFLVDSQRADGSWSYGAGPRQNWVDGFHTGYNLCALLQYQRHMRDDSFERPLRKGFEYYCRWLFTNRGIPKYYSNGLYPIDIHCCAQALIVFSEFSELSNEAAQRGDAVLRWTLRHMQSPEGFFYYQRHRFWVNRTPFMRWGQAWMFRALARFRWTFHRMPVSSLT